MPHVLSYLGGMETVGYTFSEIGGVSTYSIVYDHIVENDYLIKLDSDCFFKGSLIEPASCVIRGYKANLHLDDNLMTAISDFEKLGRTDARFKTLDELVKKYNGLWSADAEKYLLANF